MTTRQVGEGLAYETIQAAIDAAEAGDIIEIAAGTYVGNVDVDVAVTIVGAMQGVDGDDDSRDLSAGSGESTIQGLIHITVDGVSIDGIRVLNGAKTTATGSDTVGVFVQADDVTISNSVFFRDGTVDSDQSRAIMNKVADGDGLSITGNAMTGWHTGAYINGGQASEGITVTANLFEGNLVGLSMDAYPDGEPITITGNQFIDNQLEGIGVGSGAGGATWDADSNVSGNTFEGPGVVIWGPAQPAIFGGNTFQVESGDSIQAAIDAAQAGDTIMIAAGTYAESLTIGKGITLLGIGEVTIDPATGNAITISGDVGGADIVLDNLNIVGGTKGISVLQTANAGKLTVINSTISGNAQHGIYVLGDDPNNDGVAPIIAGITSIAVIDTAFANNGSSNNYNGSGNIKLFGFSGDALFQNVTITGAEAITAQNDRPDYAIEVVGYVNNGNANPVGDGAPDIGSVVFDNVVVTGAFHKNGVAISNFNEIDGLAIGGESGSLDLSGVETNWGPVFNIDSTEDATVDASDYDIVFPEGAGIVAEIQGDTKDQDETGQTIIGTSSNDALMGKGGDDTLHGGDGDDILYGADKPGNSQADDTGSDTLYGGAGTDTLYGGAGDDTLDGGTGADTLDGGAGTDTATYAATLTTASITAVADIDPETDGNQPGWQVDGGAEGTDTLTGVEVVDHGGDSNILLVGNGGFATIQAAIDAASAGDTIMIAAGTYAENVTVNKDGLTLLASGEVVIAGSFKDDNGISGTVAEFMETTNPSDNSAGTGLVVSADGVTLDGITISSFSIGLDIANGVDGLALNGVTIEDTRTGIRKSSGAAVSDVDIIGGEIRDSFIGIYLAKETASGLDISDLTIDGTAFTNLTYKGLYAETLSNALITGISMTNVGQFGNTTSGTFGAGIDLNLKWDSEATNDSATDNDAPYSGITIEDFTFVDVGLSSGSGSPHASGAAIVVKARDDAPSYSSPESASFDGAIVIQNGSIDGTSTGIRAGEPNKTNADPAVTITNVAITNAEHGAGQGDVDNLTQSTMTVTLADGGDSLLANPASTGAFIVHGGDGNDTIATGAADDTITGGAGADAIDGGSGTDTAIYAATLTTASITAVADIDPEADGNQAGWQIATGGAEGTDTLTGVEVVDHGGAANILLVGSGGFATIQAAIDAASAGDTIMIAAGTYAEDVTVNKDGLTLVGLGAVEINGTFSEDNPDYDPESESLAEWLKDAAAYTQDSVGITIAAEDVSISNITVKDSAWGVELADGANGTTLTDVVIASNIYGIYKQGTSSVSGLSIDGGSISDGYIGINFDMAAVDGGNASGVTIDGTSFSNLLRKGIYVETLSDAHITGVTMEDVGQWGSIGPNNGGLSGAGGNGININLKFGDYSDIEIDDFTFTDVGASNREGADAVGHANGGAIFIAVRDDGGTYGPNPATLSNVTIHDGTISGTTSTAIHLGEPGKDNADPAVTVTNVTISATTEKSADHGDIANETEATMIVVGTDGNDSLVASGDSDGAFDLNGGAGNDTLGGGSADDTIDGGAGDDTILHTVGDGSDMVDGGDDSDTMIVSGTDGADAIAIAFDGSGAVESIAGATTSNIEAFVVKGGAGDDTVTITGVTLSADTVEVLADADPETDGNQAGFRIDTGTATVTITEVENITDGTNAILLVGNGGFATIQAAIDAAGAGDTIMIAAGIYAESLTIGKGITLLGLGEVTIDPATGNAITIDGDVDGADIVLDNLIISGGEEGIYVDTDANAGKLTVRNSTISGNSDHGIFVLGDDPDNDASGGPITAGITAIEVIDTDFANNGFFAGLNGSGHIKLFGFTGDALFQNVTITGAEAITAQNDRPDNAIEITGYVNNGNANPVGTGAPNIGTVVFDGVTVTGSFHKNPVAVFHFTAIDGLVIGGDNGGLDLSGALSNWGPLVNLDGIEDDVIDVSGFEITFPDGASIVTEIQGDKPGQTASNQTITGTSSDDRLIGKEGDDTLNGGDGDDELHGHDKPGGSAIADDGADILNGGAGNDALYGGAGDDTLDGGTGLDTLDGGAGTDTATYAATLTTASITAVADIDPETDGNQAGWQVDGGAEGTDTLTGVEVIDHGGDSNILLVGSGGFATIQAAIDAASAGDTIMVAAGTYNENVNVTKDVTILGANDGVAGYGDRGAESIVNGRFTIQTDGVTISGFTVAAPAASSDWSGIYLDGPRDDVTISHNILDGTNSGGDSKGILTATSVIASTGVAITDNLIQNWTRGTYLNPGISDSEITGNHFEDNGNHINVDGPSGLTISDNDFGTSTGSRIAVAIFDDVNPADVGAELGLSGNTFGSGATQVTIYPYPSSGEDGQHIIGTALNDSIRGDSATPAGLDATYDGGAGDDVITGGTGDDTLDGGTGIDTLDGGAGTDTAVFSDETGAVIVTLDGANAATVTVGGLDRGTLANVENVIAGSGDDILTGDANANVFTGGAGSDTIDGGGGNDTVVYAGTLAISDVVTDGTGWQVAGGAEGTDTLSNVKFVQHAGGRLLLIGNGGFADINEAVVEATRPGDTILFAAPPAPDVPIVVEVTPTAPVNLTIPYDNPTEITLTSDFDNAIQTGGGDDVIIINGTGDNIIKTGDGNDYVQASVGNDQIIGGSGNGDDVYDGGGGGNTMIYTSATNSITVDLNLLDRSTTAASEGGTVGDMLDKALGSGNADTPVGLAQGIDIGTDALLNIVSLIAGSGGDTLIGNGDGNTIEGRAGDDTITGNAGADILTGGLGTDDVDGGSGNDTLNYVAGDGTDTLLDGGADSDTLAITGRTGDNATSADTIKVGVTAGVIVKLTSNDATHGIANNVANIESVTLDLATGHSGNDTLDYSITTSGNAITVNLGTNSATGFAGTISGVENVSGGAGGDSLTGDGTANVLAGNAGDDTLTGGGGADVLTGGTGIDSVYGGDGNDTIHYTIGDGVDAAIDGGGDTDTLVVKGTAATETIDVVFNGTVLTTLEGAGLTSIESVTLDALGGTDTLSYAGSTGAVTVNLGTGTASGFTSIAGVERVTGGNLADTLTGDGSNNTLEGADGADILDGGAGDDTLVGGTGADTLTGGTGTDTAVYAAALSATAATFNGTTWLLDGGAEGTDTLAGIERVTHGGVGQFLLVGGGAYANRSTAEAAMGANDVLVFAATTSAVSDTDGTANLVSEDVANGTAVGIDASATTGTGGGSVTYSLSDDAGGRFAIDVTTGVVTVANGALIDYEAATSHAIVVRATNSLGSYTDQAFTIDVEDVTASLITGTKGNDTLIGTSEPDTIDGGKGNDKLYGGGGDDVLTGGKGKDLVDGGDGIDTASYAASSKGVKIDLGKSKQKGGDAAGDKLISIENVVGSNKGDKIVGNNGDNVLDGGAGKDKLYAKGGNDLLIGGTGKDTFYFKKGYDRVEIADFSNGDKIDISMKGVKTFVALKGMMDEVDGDVVIDFGKGDVLTISDTSVDSLGRADFHL